MEDLEKIAQAVALDDPLLLIGETGVGKTSLIRHLAYLTHNSFQRFNLSGQTEKLHFIGGYYPSEHGEFVWRDGVLIEAMRGGQWLVIDEINLAPSQVIERMNSLLDDDGFLVVTEHQREKYVRQSAYDGTCRAYTATIMGERGLSAAAARREAERRLTAELIFPIHPDFRIFATMNPSEYSGRQRFSPALLNRFRVKLIDEPSLQDLQTILSQRYATIGSAMIDAVLAVHGEMVMAARTTPDVTVRYTIRHLMRWMSRLILARRNQPDESLGCLAWIEGQEIYADGLSETVHDIRLREQLTQHLRTQFGRQAVEPSHVIAVHADTVHCGDVRLPRLSGPRRYFVSGPGLVQTPSTTRLLTRLAKAVRLNERVLLVGPTGGGKSDVVRYLADLTNHGFITLDLDGQSDVAQLIGQHVPVEGQDRYAWLDGRLTPAMHSGSWILIDEMNLAAPEIVERLNSLLDDDGSLTIHEHRGEKWVPAPVYRAFEAEDHDLTHLRMIHPEFRLFAAMNAEPHPGRATMSAAMLNKFYQVWVPQQGTVEEEERIVGDYLPHQGGSRGCSAT